MILCLTADCSPLQEPDGFARALDALPEWRQTQILARSSPEHRAAGAGAWLLLQQGARQLNLPLPSTPPAYQPHGKPYFPQLPFFSFSLAHSGSRCLCLMGDTENRLGCDLEKLRPLPQWEGLAKRFFHPQEVRWLSRQRQPEPAFFRLWCEKEGVLKATGAGFSRGMKQFSLRGGGQEPFPFFRVGWTEGGYAYCLCFEKARPELPRRWIKEVSIKELL